MKKWRQAFAEDCLQMLAAFIIVKLKSALMSMLEMLATYYLIRWNIATWTSVMKMFRMSTTVWTFITLGVIISNP